MQRSFNFYLKQNMKNNSTIQWVILCLTSLLFSTEIRAQELKISNPLIVSTGVNDGFSRPRISLINDNQPFVIWVKTGSPNTLYASGKTAEGFDTPMIIGTPGVNPMVTMSAGPNSAARNDTVYIALFSKPVSTSGIFMMRSFDGGKTFNNPVRMVALGSRYIFMPSMHIAPNGEPVSAFITTNTSWLTAFYEVSRSKDGGETFESAIRASSVAPAEVCDCCPASMAFEGDREILMFRNNNNNIRDIWVSMSENRGATFEKGSDIDQTDWEISGCPSTGPDGIISDDSLVSVFMSGAGLSGRIMMSSTSTTSLKTGSHFFLNNDVPQFANQNYPMIAGHGDTLGVVWQQSYQGKTGVFFTWSVNGIDDLKTNIVELDPQGSNNLVTPHIIYANGIFHIVYSDETEKQIMYRQIELQKVSTSVKKSVGIPSIEILPNPTSGHSSIVFPFSDNWSISLYSSSGQLLTTSKFTNTQRGVLEGRHLEPGVYFVKAGTTRYQTHFQWVVN